MYGATVTMTTVDMTIVVEVPRHSGMRGMLPPVPISMIRTILEVELGYE